METDNEGFTLLSLSRVVEACSPN